MFDQVSQNPTIKEGYVLRTDFQTAGRGQIGNQWESEAGKNLLASIFLKPEISVEEQFLISKVICLAMVELLNEYDLEQVRIKWPNDIYVADKKIAGILIQNMLQGKKVKSTVIGIGLNINQELFYSDAPNPTSLKLELKKELSVEKILILLLDKLNNFYAKISLGQKTEIDNLYKFLLYRRNEIFTFRTGDGKTFDGSITDVSKTGQLLIKTEETIRQFGFREIKYVL